MDSRNYGAEPGPDAMRANPQYPGMQVFGPIENPKRSRKALYIVFGVLAAFALCAFGGIALLAAGGKAAVDKVHVDAASRAADVKIVSCRPDEFGLVSVHFTIENRSGATQDYMPHFQFEDKKGTIVGDAYGIATDLPSGKNFTGDATGTTSTKDPITCKLLDA